MLEPKILHIETSSRTCSVALSSGRRPLSWISSDQINDHSAALVPMIQQVLAKGSLGVRDLVAVSVSIGPGSYTGLRVGLSTAKGICYGAGIPLIAVSTLESLAWTAMSSISSVDRMSPDIIYVSVLDARRNDAYVAVFDKHCRRLVEDQFLTIAPGCLDHLIANDQKVVIRGEGLARWEELAVGIGAQLVPVECHALNLVPCAADAFYRGKFADLSSCIPAYLKPPNITVPAVKR